MYRLHEYKITEKYKQKRTEKYEQKSICSISVLLLKINYIETKRAIINELITIVRCLPSSFVSTHDNFIDHRLIWFISMVDIKKVV